MVVGLVALLALPVSAAQAADRGDGSTPAPAGLVQLVTNVPTSTLNKVGAGDVLGPGDFTVSKLDRKLERHGKPEFLSMNLAWCPHCAANSWALAVALSRFGTLTGLRVINTGTYYCKLVRDSCNLSPSPCYPNTHGLSFLDAGYTSRYLSFSAVVLQDLHGHNIEKLTRRNNAALNQFDRQGETPAVDVGGSFGFLNSGFSPGALAGMTWSQIAGSLANPHNRVARRVDGLANVFTAAICKVTRGRPAMVCRSHGVTAAGNARLG